MSLWAWQLSLSLLYLSIGDQLQAGTPTCLLNTPILPGEGRDRVSLQSLEKLLCPASCLPSMHSQSWLPLQAEGDDRAKGVNLPEKLAEVW